MSAVPFEEQEMRWCSWGKRVQGSQFSSVWVVGSILQDLAEDWGSYGVAIESQSGYPPWVSQIVQDASSRGAGSSPQFSATRKNG